MSKLRVNTVVNRTNTDKVIFPYGIGVTNGITCAGVVTATAFVGSGASLTDVPGEISIQGLTGGTNATGIATIRVGTGLSIVEYTSGIGSIKLGTQLEGFTVGVTTINTSGRFRSQATESIYRSTFSNLSGLTTQICTDFAGAVVSVSGQGVFRLSDIGVPKRLAEAQHVGIITSSGGFVAAGSSLGFTGPLFSPGISTVSYLQATTFNTGAGATIGGRLVASQDVAITRNLIVSGISTFNSVSATISGDVNSTGVSTISQLQATTVNASGIITATGGFVGDVTGDVTGAISGDINSSGVSTFVDLHVTQTIYHPAGIATIQQINADTLNISGIATASQFSGDATGLTGSPNITVGILTVTSSTHHNGSVFPTSDNAHDLGSASLRWANIYSADMHFSNEGMGNSVDGSWGSWTLQEGENDIFMLNNRTGKRYKINLTEVD